MKCKHNWLLLEKGFYDEVNQAEQYETYYCSICLDSCVVEYPKGKRTIVYYGKEKDETKQTKSKLGGKK